MIRERLRVQGIVQGVGFRPFVHRLAHELHLAGWVRNDAAGVTIEAQGSAQALTALRARLGQEAPARSRIDQLLVDPLPLSEDEGFRIVESAASGHGASIGPDSCTCPACLDELLSTTNRRYRYPFINCTDCGPRYTIAQSLPYDRARTSMAGFSLCPDCAAEYADPADRRFHAEPNACPACGPQLQLIDAHGEHVVGDPIAETVLRLQRGEIVAIKGLGGFHLACDARNAEAVARLRERKQREEKPFALMLANRASLAEWVELSEDEAATLESAARPIVLLRKRKGCGKTFPGVAPGLAWLGVMLPYTPLHTLLFHEAAGRPLGMDWLAEAQALALVMTSANPHGEPLVIDNDDARRELAGIADAFLLHDRAIAIRCDDSVLRHGAAGGAPQFLRRARGYTPAAIPLGRAAPQVLALGGFYKNALCFTRDDQAFLSQHIGDLDRVANCRTLEAAADHFQRLLQVRPQAVAHDLHPDFFSSQLALRLAERWGVPAIGVQHHHAHIAAVLAEHRLDGPVLGLALDGIGMGTDGAAWGGELLQVEGDRSERLGHLQTLGLPGGDKAAREPWRMGAAALSLLGNDTDIALRFSDEPGADLVAQMLARGVPRTSSAGRWFDAAAGLLGVQARSSFEGQAAMRLEGLAEKYGPISLHRTRYELRREDTGLVLDFAPLLRKLLTCRKPARGAARFHATFIEGLAEWVRTAAEATGIDTVACGGGCFLNALLARGLRTALESQGLRMLEAHAAPPGDGGLALGQAWVAQRTLERLGKAASERSAKPPSGASPSRPGSEESKQEHTTCA